MLIPHHPHSLAAVLSTFAHAIPAAPKSQKSPFFKASVAAEGHFLQAPGKIYAALPPKSCQPQSLKLSLAHIR